MDSEIIQGLRGGGSMQAAYTNIHTCIVHKIQINLNLLFFGIKRSVLERFIPIDF